jgi:predicted transposase YbfD/YdcC
MWELRRTSIDEQFGTLRDPRRDHLKAQRLLDILTIALWAVICGADDWVEVETFGPATVDWLRTFLDLPGGIPSHDPFGRVFARLDPDDVRRGFVQWVKAVVGEPGQQVVAGDGKTLRRSHDRRSGRAALHLVSAWASTSGVVLWQVATEAKSNEITAIPVRLKLLALEGAVVTIDAMGCHTAIAQQSVEQRADYVLARKKNHEQLYDRVVDTFVEADKARGTTLLLGDLAADTTTDAGHGRIERRRCRAIGDPAHLAYLDPDHDWPGLRSVVCIESTRRLGNAVSTEARYYLSSLPPDAPTLAQVIRSHWRIENSLHWVLDVAFREDDSRVRTGHAPENFASIRHLALNLLRQDTSRPVGLANKRFRAALDTAYVRSILDRLSA